MRWTRRFLILVACLMGIGVLAFYWRVIRATQGPPPAVASSTAEAAPARRLDAPSVTFIDPSRGPKDAKATIVEFGDYLCPYCRDSGAAVDQLLQARPNDVRFVWKNDPSPLHPGADTAAEAALCAYDQGQFWAYHQKLFDSQDTFTQTSLAVTADGLGLDDAKFTSCLANHDAQPRVARTVEEGKELGVAALPTFFINGKRYEGALTYDQLVQAIDGNPQQ